MGQRSQLDLPSERRALTMVGRCDFEFVSGESSYGEAAPKFRGRLAYVDINSAGDILISGCPVSDPPRSRPCHNIFKGNVEQLCEREIKARQTHASISGVIDLASVGVPGVGALGNFMPDVGGSRPSTTGGRIVESLIPGSRAARDISKADCLATKNLLSLARKEMRCTDFDNISTNTDLYCREVPTEKCAVAPLMDLLALTTPERERARIAESPSVIAEPENGIYRMSIRPDIWYSAFQNKEEERAAQSRSRANVEEDHRPHLTKPVRTPANRAQPARNGAR